MEPLTALEKVSFGDAPGVEDWEMRAIMNLAIGPMFLFLSRGQASQIPGEMLRCIDEIFELDGTRESLENRMLVFEASMEIKTGLYQYSAEEIAAMREWAQIVLGGPEFPQDYAHGFAESFDLYHARAVLKWMRSPVVKKFRALEAELEAPDGMERLNLFLRSPERARISKHREEILKRYAELTRCPEQQLELFVNKTLAEESVRNHFRSEEEKWNGEDFRLMAERIREQYRERFELGCWVPDLWVYRDVTDAELEEYLSFYETEAGQWYTQAHWNASRQAWISGGLRVGQAGFIWPKQERPTSKIR